MMLIRNQTTARSKPAIIQKRLNLQNKNYKKKKRNYVSEEKQTKQNQTNR